MPLFGGWQNSGPSELPRNDMYSARDFTGHVAGLLVLQGMDNIVGLCDCCHLKSDSTISNRDGTFWRPNSLTALYFIVFCGLSFPVVISPILRKAKNAKRNMLRNKTLSYSVLVTKGNDSISLCKMHSVIGSLLSVFEAVL